MCYCLQKNQVQIFSQDDRPFDIFTVLLGFFFFPNQCCLIIISAEKHAVSLSVILPSNYCISCRIVPDVRLFSTSDKVRLSQEF